jgi:hypothetical protein
MSGVSVCLLESFRHGIGIIGRKNALAPFFLFFGLSLRLRLVPTLGMRSALPSRRVGSAPGG